MKVALYGGSFDPIHDGHGAVIEHCLQMPDFDQVWVLPCINHAFGKQLAPYHLRAEMIHLHMQDTPGVSKMRVVCREETYTYDMMVNLRAEYPDHEFTLVFGSDILHVTHKWAKWEELRALTPMFFFSRPGYEGGTVREQAMPEISSTVLREALSQGRIPQGMAPRVIKLALEKRLYQKI